MKQSKYSYFKTDAFINGFRKALFLLSTILLLLGLFYFLLLATKFNKLSKETIIFKSVTTCNVCIEDLIAKWNETELNLRNYTLDDTPFNYSNYKNSLLELDSLLSEMKSYFSNEKHGSLLKELIGKNQRLEGSLLELRSNLDELIYLEVVQVSMDSLQELREKLSMNSTSDPIQISKEINSLFNQDTTTVKEKLTLLERIKFVLKAKEVEKLKINNNQIYNIEQQTLIKSYLEKSKEQISDGQKEKFNLFKSYLEELKKQELLLVSNKFLIINKFKTLLFEMQDYQKNIVQQRVESNLDLILKSANELRFFGILNLITLIIYLITLFFYNYLIVRSQKSLKEEMSYNTILVEEKSTYLASLAHELKNPVSIILSLSNLFKENLVKRQNFNNIADSITLTSKMISKMLNDIILINKEGQENENNEFYEFNPDVTIINIVNSFQVIANQKDISLEFVQTNHEDTKLFGSEMILNQVLFNLISNALRYTDEGSVQIYYTLKNLKSNKVILTVSVSDTGRGIKESEFSNMFKKYYRSSSSLNTVGTGLGLHISKNLLEQVGGTITIESIINKGSVFTFTMPCEIVDSALPVSNNESSGLISNYLGGKSILLVDDNYSILQYVMHIFSKLPIKLLTSEKISSLESIIKEEEIGLVLTDYYIGAGNGIEVLHLIKKTKESEDIPVILLSSSPIIPEIANDEDIQFDGHIVKPFTPDEFLDELARIIHKISIKKK